MNKAKRADNALYKIMRQMAIERDGGMCVLCKSAPASEVHHIVFRSQQGKSNLSNLACLCRECHNRAHGVDAKNVRKILIGLLEKKDG